MLGPFSDRLLVIAFIWQVTIQYRLGIFGYFSHPDLSHTNVGTLDQIMALEWIKDNIAAFGGDADNVTIFGESAGGESVAHLFCSPLAAGLFHKAVFHSANVSNQFVHREQPFLHYVSADQAGVDFATRMVGSEPGQLERMQALPAVELASKSTGNL